MPKDDGFSYGQGYVAGCCFEARSDRRGWWFRMKGCRRKSSWHGPYSCRSAAERAAAHLAQSGFTAGLQPRYK